MWPFRPQSRKIFTNLLLIAGALLSWFSLDRLPQPLSAQASADFFSAQRALLNVKSLSQSSRQLGTSAHEVTKKYLVEKLSDLGCLPTLQETKAVTLWRGAVFAGPVENIICTLKGTRSQGALLFMSHYDSVHNSPGAADSATGVAIILETIRALKGSPHSNDLVILFTDGEENGLLGSSAFIRDEWHKKLDIKMLMNFEARGNSGPFALFETQYFNSAISLAVQKAPHPVGNSFLDFLYQFLPNDTDVSVFKGTGIPALNYAFARGLEHYHHSSDTAENLSLESLQHAGNTALETSRALLEEKLNGQNQNSIYLYQDFLGYAHLSYPANLLRAFSFLMIFAIITILWKLKPRPLPLFLGTLSSLFFLLSSVGLALFFQKTVARLWGGDQIIIHFYSFFLIYILCLFSLLHFLFLKIKLRLPEVTYGTLLILLVFLGTTLCFVEIGVFIVWTSLGLVIAHVKVTRLTRILTFAPLLLLSPSFIHGALIADSGTQLALPTFLWAWSFLLWHAIPPHPCENTTQKTNGYPLLHSFCFLGGAACLFFTLYQNSVTLREEFFEISNETETVVALKKDSTQRFFQNPLLASKAEAYLELLWRWNIKPTNYNLYPTAFAQKSLPQVKFSLWEKSGSNSPYLIEVPAQDFNCAQISLLPFEDIQKLKINGLEPFRIPLKKFMKEHSYSFVESCGLKKTSLRIEFELPFPHVLPRESWGIFTLESLPPEELSWDPQKVIFSHFSKTHYVLKKITL